MIAIDIGQALDAQVREAWLAEAEAKERAAVVAIAAHGLDGLCWVIQQGPALGCQVTRLERHGAELWRCWWDTTGEYTMTLRERWAMAGEVVP